MHHREKQQFCWVSSTDRQLQQSLLALVVTSKTAKTRPCIVIALWNNSSTVFRVRELFYHLQYEYACMQDEFIDEIGAVYEYEFP